MKSYTILLLVVCLSLTAINQASDNNNNKNNNSILACLFKPVTGKMEESTNRVIEKMETSTKDITYTVNKFSDGPSWLMTGSAGYANVKMIQFAAQNPRYVLPVAGGVVLTSAVATIAYDKRMEAIKRACQK